MNNRAAAFTLVELMIVVAILGNLALIAVPAYLRARWTAQNVRFLSDLRTMTAAFQFYAAEHGRYPAEAAAGVQPSGIAPYLKSVAFHTPTSIGGKWDWDYNQGYAIAAVCVDLSLDADLLQMVDIDTKIDNGILSTGSFRERSVRRYAYIIE
jgi:prepilin-type N-terminal cleavage/methylation domain-containing protein